MPNPHQLAARLDQLESVVLIHNTLHHHRSSSLLRTSPLLALGENSLLARVIQHLVLALHNALRLLASPFLLRELDQAAQINCSALVTRAGTLVVEAVQDLGIGCGVGADQSVNWRVGVVDMLGEKLEERFREWGRSVVVGFDDRGDFVRRAGAVVSVWLGVLVRVRLVHDRAELLHWANLVLGEWERLFGAVELRIERNLGTSHRTVTVAPFLGLFLVPLGWEGVRSDIATLKWRCWASG